MKKILFVCTGNTCRSPMAEALARDWLKRQHRQDIEVASAGLAAINNYPASDQAVEVMRQRQLDLSWHSSRMLDGKDVSEADLILVMTPGHLDHLLKMYPQAEGKVKLLAAEQIADPFGRSVEDYKRCAAQLEEAVVAVLEQYVLRDQDLRDKPIK